MGEAIRESLRLVQVCRRRISSDESGEEPSGSSTVEDLRILLFEVQPQTVRASPYCDSDVLPVTKSERKHRLITCPSIVTVPRRDGDDLQNAGEEPSGSSTGRISIGMRQLRICQDPQHWRHKRGGFIPRIKDFQESKNGFQLSEVNCCTTFFCVNALPYLVISSSVATSMSTSSSVL